MNATQWVSHAATITTLVDMLIPGDDRLPSGTGAGVHYWLLDKGRTVLGDKYADLLIEALHVNGLPLDQLCPQAQIAAVEQFEHSHPGLYDLFRRAAYIGYYQNSAVKREVQRLSAEV